MFVCACYVEKLKEAKGTNTEKDGRKMIEKNDKENKGLLNLKKLHLSAVGYFDIRFFEGCVITGKRSLIEKDEIKNLLKQNMTNQS